MKFLLLDLCGHCPHILQNCASLLSSQSVGDFRWSIGSFPRVFRKRRMGVRADYPLNGGLVHTWSQRVTTQQGGRNGPWPPTAIPPLHPQPSSASAAATLSNQRMVPVSAAVGGSPNAEEMHHALSSSSNYGEQRPGTSLGYDVCPYQKNSSPACAASRTWQPADASTQSGSGALVSQQ